MICVSSNHSTIHIFQLNKLTENLRLKKMERYLKGDVSFSRLRALTPNKAAGICQCAFDKNSDSIIALANDGSYFNFQFDKNTGSCKKQNYCFSLS
uniref:WD repeat domain phosphoinositide-interacting protein 2 n=1 Tax=Ditylenchus dipsaci TaxID=166011 RepID=A0A915D032_9BILA